MLKQLFTGLFTIIFILLLVVTPLFALFLGPPELLAVSPSLQANGMGQTCTTTAAASPLTALINPASLGLFARNHYIATEFYVSKTDWLKINNVYRSQFNANATSLGLNLKQYTGLTFKSQNSQFNIIAFSWSRQASDLLVYYYKETGPNITWSGTKDIDFWNDAIRGKFNNQAACKKGHEINLADFIFLRGGLVENMAKGMEFSSLSLGLQNIDLDKLFSQ